MWTVQATRDLINKPGIYEMETRGAQFENQERLEKMVLAPESQKLGPLRVEKTVRAWVIDPVILKN